MREDGNGYLPGFLEFFPSPKEEELEREFWDLLLDEIDCDEFNELAHAREYVEYYKTIKRLGEKYCLDLPKGIERQCRQWKGKDAFKALKKIAGIKQEIRLFERIHDQIPLSLRGFAKTEENGRILWTRKIGKKEITVWVGGPGTSIKPATGDLAKRVFMGTCLFAKERKTLDPGPIEFKELLELVGELKCSQREREIIRGYLESFAVGGIMVRGTDGRYFDYAPFYKRFTWEGGVEYGAKIYPIFNEEIFKMLTDENLRQYIFIDISRLKKTKGLTGRDELAQDQFRTMRGFSVQQIKMINWLYKFGQFTDAKISKMPLSQIKKFANKNFIQAKQVGFIRDYKINRYQKKNRYLDQLIYIYPAKPEKPIVQLTQDKLIELDEIIDWLYEVGEEDYAHSSYEEVKENLMNAAKAGNLDCIKKAKEWVEDEYDPLCPVDDLYYENRPMLFWNTYRRLVMDKKDA